jgi:hypothetical protein
MSRLSVPGTDETGDTVKVEPEHNNQNTRACVDSNVGLEKSYFYLRAAISDCLLIGFIRARKTLERN